MIPKPGCSFWTENLVTETQPKTKTSKVKILDVSIIRPAATHPATQSAFQPSSNFTSLPASQLATSFHVS